MNQNIRRKKKKLGEKAATKYPRIVERMVAWSVAAFNNPLKLDKFSKYSPRMSKGGVFKLWSQTTYVFHQHMLSSVQDGNCALRQAHMSSIPFLISFPSCFWKECHCWSDWLCDVCLYPIPINSCYPWQMSLAGNYQFAEHWNKTTYSKSSALSQMMMKWGWHVRDKL